MITRHGGAYQPGRYDEDQVYVEELLEGDKGWGLAAVRDIDVGTQLVEYTGTDFAGDKAVIRLTVRCGTLSGHFFAKTSALFIGREFPSSTV